MSIGIGQRYAPNADKLLRHADFRQARPVLPIFAASQPETRQQNNDYTRRDATRLWLKGVLYVASAFTIALGTLVIFTFDPSIS